jgi:hypothetical protein
MRGLFAQLGRGVVAGLVVAAITVPVSAKPVEKERRPPSKVVKMLQNLVKALGDGIIAPRP